MQALFFKEIYREGDTVTIQWFPGHMTKARKLIQENVKMVDIVIEILDARIPNSSRNPILSELIGDTPRLIVLNKADLASQNLTQNWIKYFSKNGMKAVAVDSVRKKGINDVKKIISKTLPKSKAAQKFNLQRPIRAMVVGIPNVGKSMFINALVGRACTKTENRPGVTRGKQWINIDEEIQLLDTPGILWPKFNDPQIGLHLAYANVIGSKAYDKTEITLELLKYLSREYPNNLKDIYKLSFLSENPTEILAQIAKSRGYIVKGGGYDVLKTSENILKNFRDGKLGKITIEKPEENINV